MVNSTEAAAMRSPEEARRASWASLGMSHVWAAVGVALATAVSWALHGLIADESLSMFFLSAVLVPSVVYGRNTGIFAALAAFLSYNILVLEPRFSFRFAPLGDALTLVVFLGAALLTGSLAGRVRDQARAMARRASTMTMLFQASQALARSADRAELVSILADQVAAATESPTYVFVRSGEGVAWAATGLPPRAEGEAGARQPSAEIAAFAAHAWTRAGSSGISLPAGPPADRLSVFPLGSMRQPMGLLICERRAAGKKHRGMDEQTFAVFCEIGAIALERTYLTEQMTKTQVLAETEKLRTALLSSVSHDFRTPLSGIIASATALIQHGPDFTEESSRELLTNIRDQAAQINRYVANLLDMIKLESGSIDVKLEPTDPIDIISAATRRCSEPYAENRQGWIRSVSDNQVCLVEADPVLLEQAIFNVLENAGLYSPPDSTIEISLHASLHLVEIVIADAGPGIPPEELERVFDKFYRISGDNSAVRGTGLGLSICRGLVEAMGGSVSAVSPVKDGHGTAIHICLRRASEA
jgi:two-component system sensor histidine kinase KdpD